MDISIANDPSPLKLGCVGTWKGRPDQYRGQFRRSPGFSLDPFPRISAPAPRVGQSNSWHSRRDIHSWCSNAVDMGESEVALGGGGGCREGQQAGTATPIDRLVEHIETYYGLSRPAGRPRRRTRLGESLEGELWGRRGFLALEGTVWEGGTELFVGLLARTDQSGRGWGRWQLGPPPHDVLGVGAGCSESSYRVRVGRTVSTQRVGPELLRAETSSTIS